MGGGGVSIGPVDLKPIDLATGGLSFQAREGKKAADEVTGIAAAKRESEAAINAMNEGNQAILKSMKEGEAKKEADAQSIANRDAQLRRQRAMGGQSQGRQGTILTSPLGVPGGPSGSGKTLLGV